MSFNIDRKDIKEIESFVRNGSEWTKVYADDENHIYVFFNGKDAEVIIGVKHKNTDGSIVYVYPSTTQFGRYGYYIAGPRFKERIKQRILEFKEKSTERA